LGYGSFNAKNGKLPGFDNGNIPAQYGAPWAPYVNDKQSLIDNVRINGGLPRIVNPTVISDNEIKDLGKKIDIAADNYRRQ
jgi:hypothetical protein